MTKKTKSEKHQANFAKSNLAVKFGKELNKPVRITKPAKS